MATVLQAFHEEGADGTTTFIDESDSAITLTAVGQAQWDSAQAPTGLDTSVLLDGTDNVGVTSVQSPLGLTTNSFTVEFWWRYNTSSGSQNMIDMRDGGGFGLVIGSNDTQNIFYFSAAVFRITTTRLSEGVWRHIAVSRDGASSRMFIEGSQVGPTVTDNTNLGSTNPIRIGSNNTNTQGLNGWMAAVRINNGEALYTSNFTPPTLPFDGGGGGGPVTTAWLLPTVAALEAGNGLWTLTSNILADDGSEAALTLTTKNLTATYLEGSMFGFDSTIPLGATIDQVEVRADWRVTSAGGSAILEAAAFVGGSSTGAILANSVEPTSLTTDVFNITADRAWTRDDLLNSTFTMKVRGRNGNSATNPFYRFDHIAARVVYTASTEASDSIRIRLPAQYEGQGVGGIFFGNRVN